MARAPRSSSPASRLLAGVVFVAGVWVVLALARHPGFQPTYMLRTAAPVVALLLGAAFTHRVAKRRAQVDVEGEFNPSGRALFLGVVMLAATLLSWLLVSQAAPASITAQFGVSRSETGSVVERVEPTNDPDCRYRLVISSASIARPLDECVPEPLWRQAKAGGPVTLDLVAGALGAELVGVGP
jgi:hypothetical protein